MSVTQLSRELKKYRVPQEHGTALVAPSDRSSGELLLTNRHRADQWTGEIFDVPLTELREAAQSEALAQALDYTTQYRDCTFARQVTAPSLIISGHQPDLFHSGVWFKNFALSCLADRHDSIGIQLLIDNDIAQPWIEAPVQAAAAVRRTSLPYDVSALPLPFEDCRLHDASLFESFGERVAAAVEPLVEDPIITELWPIALSVARRESNLGLLLSQSRHLLEERHGLQTLELPLSKLCETEPFYLLLLHLLGDLNNFASTYNSALLDYRTINRLRSRTHPVPALAATAGWQETPFWIWSSDSPVRKPLFVRRDDRRLLLQGGLESQSTPHEIAADRRGRGDLMQLANAGFKIRPRALMTTMFARLFLGDLFLHGIGGAKYDQLTDMIIEQYFDICPPEYMILSATFRLPMDRAPVEQDDLRQVDGLLRELYYQPDRNLEAAGADVCQELVELKMAKQQLLQKIPAQGQRKSWHFQLEQLNQQLRQHVQQSRNLLLSEKQRLSHQLKNDAVMCARDYSFCLHSSRTLFGSLLDLAEQIS